MTARTRDHAHAAPDMTLAAMKAAGLAALSSPGAQWPISGIDRASALQTNLWHAYASTDDLRAGAGLLVTGGHRLIRLRTGDRLTIELPSGQRYSALVLEREGPALRIAGQDGAVHDLLAAPATDCFADFELSAGFSRETWSFS